MTTDPIKILVVDDSALYRQSIHNVLREIDDISVVGIAKNGIDALEKIAALDPDLLTLDVQMPDMNGIQVLKEMKRQRFRSKALVVSSLTSNGAQVTTDALMEGAFDFILKPSGTDSAANRAQLAQELLDKISAFRESSHRLKRGVSSGAERGQIPDNEAVPSPQSVCQVVVIGTSTGGPQALKIVLSKLPSDLPVPVLVVQHMPAGYTRSLAARLNELSSLDVLEATDRISAIAGKVYIAPGGKQMKLARSGRDLQIRITDSPPENSTRPSADYLLRSAAEVLGGDALAVILTGMGRDGLEGCRQLKAVKGFVFAQSSADCVVYGMPKSVIEEGLADRELTLGKVAPAIVRHLKRSRRS